MNAYYNPYIVIPFLAWFTAHTVKFLRHAQKGELNFRYFYSSGEMPSAHSALVTALVTTALVTDGITSPIFGMSGVFAVVVIYDSLGVRRASGDQAVVINTILKNLKNNQNLANLKLREALGHKPAEVVAGALLGATLALLATTSSWAADARFLVETSGSIEKNVYLSIFATLILAAVASYGYFGKYKSYSTIKKLRPLVSWPLGLVGGLGLLLTFFQVQKLPTLQWRLWPLTLLAALIATQFMLTFRCYRYVPALYRQDALDLQAHTQAKKTRKTKKTNSKKSR